MYLETIYQLKCDDLVIQEGEHIKVFLKNEEVLKGYYSHSDCTGLELVRWYENEEWIDFDDVIRIEVVGEVK